MRGEAGTNEAEWNILVLGALVYFVMSFVLPNSWSFVALVGLPSTPVPGSSLDIVHRRIFIYRFDLSISLAD